MDEVSTACVVIAMLLVVLLGILLWMCKIDHQNRRLRIVNEAVWHCALGHHPTVERLSKENIELNIKVMQLEQELHSMKVHNA